MPLSDLFEGADDALFRNEAHRVLALMIKEIRASPELVSVGPRQLIVKAGNLSSLPSNLFVQFDFHPGSKPPEAEFAPTVSGGKARIVIDIYTDVNEPGFDTIDFVTSNGPLIRDAFVHEYIHYLDWTRIGHDTWSKMSKRLKKKEDQYSPDGKLRNYYQDPIEQNAIFQQTADQVSQEVDSSIVRSMGIDNFYRLFVKRMSELTSGAPGSYRERQIPQLKKRVAQLYSELIGSG